MIGTILESGKYIKKGYAPRYRSRAGISVSTLHIKRLSALHAESPKEMKRMLNQNQVESKLPEILRSHYGLQDFSLRFLREGGSRVYLVEGESGYLLKVIGAAFADTARQSVSVMRFLESRDFPVPKTLLTQSGEALLETSLDGETLLILLQEYIEGDEPDLEVRAPEVGDLVSRLHCLLEQYPDKLVSRGYDFFIGRYLDILRKKNYPGLSAYEELGRKLWQKVSGQPEGNCHGDLHRGNLLEAADGQIYLLDFDTVCYAPVMFDVMVMCDMTDYFRSLTAAEKQSFPDWVAIRHFQLQATIVETYGPDCIDTQFIDWQLHWLKSWLEAKGA